MEFQAAIKRFLAETNADPRPFRWTKDPARDHRRRQKRAPCVRFYPLGPPHRATGSEAFRRTKGYRYGYAEWRNTT